MHVIAYAYEADYHCISCTLERFCSSRLLEDELDGEGNPLHSVYDIDEHETPLHCGTCGEEIYE